MQRLLFIVLMLALGSSLALAQQRPRQETQKQEIQLGSGMSLIAPGLIQIGSETNLFLTLAEQIGLTNEQRIALEKIAWDFQRFSVQRIADLNVAEAELERLLTRENIDLAAVRAKIREAESIATEVKIRKVEALLKAINTLTHEQHLKIVTLYREPAAPKMKPQVERIL